MCQSKRVGRWAAACVCALCASSVWAVLTDIRSYDGSGNNLTFTDYGAAGQNLLRISGAAYPGDGSGSTIINDSTRANPRVISNAIASQGGSLFNSHHMSDLVWQWGQFIDHDLDLTKSNAANGFTPIAVPPGDILGPGPIPFSRSDFDPTTGTAGNPRQHINSITAWLDGSNVYGSSAAQALGLREDTINGAGTGAKLKTSAGGLLLPVDGSGHFFAGDERAEEQVGLTATHTLFVREHNRLVDILATSSLSLSDEEMYQVARKYVGAQIQAITFQEFLPALLGNAAPDPSAFSYDANLNPGIATEFSTAFYRFGHTMLASNILTMNTDGTHAGYIALRDAFFNPSLLMNDASLVDKILAGLGNQRAQEIDNRLVDDVRSFLFGPPGAGGMDLASLNIQRGRDHGLPDYNTIRVAYGLTAATTFADITSDPQLQAILASLYGDVNNIDPWVGALAEDHMFGVAVGELIAAALIDQFTRLRDADRFFYLNDPDLLSPDLIALLGDVRDTTLRSVIMRNTSMSEKAMPSASAFFVAIPEPVTAGLVLLGAMIIGGRRVRRA